MLVTLFKDRFNPEMLSKLDLNERQTRAIELIKDRGSISLADLQKIYKSITRKTLYRDLQSLVEQDVLKAHGDRKGRKYSF